MIVNTPSIEKIMMKPSSRQRQLLVIILLFVCTFLVFKSPRQRIPWAGTKKSGVHCINDHGKVDTEHRRFTIVLDAGSTGSRVHVYRFKLCGQRIESVEDELFAEVKPGLSSYASNPSEAAKSLVPLLSKAKEKIPKDLQPCTPIVLKATAGLRLLKESDSTAILDHVRRLIEKTPFHVGPIKQYSMKQEMLEKAVDVMDGREEGLLAWMTVKFLQSEEKLSPAVLELGGGSAQIVFQVDRLPSEKELWDKYYTKEYFGGHDHVMYQNSYLGYGLKEARRTILKEHVLKSNNTLPCLPRNFNTTVEVAQSSKAFVYGAGSDWDLCYKHVSETMFPEGVCKWTSGCSFNGVHQPQIRPNTPVLAFSYFNDRLGPVGLTDSASISDIEMAGRKVCQNDAEKAWYCLDLVYIHALLSRGFGLNDNFAIKCTKKIKGYEAGWALGSAVKVLGRSELGTCPRY